MTSKGSNPDAVGGVTATHGNWYVLAILFLAAVLSYTDRLILNALVEPVKLDLHLSDTQISLLQGAAFAVIYAVAALPLGTLADFTHRRNLLVGGVVLWTAGTALCGLAHSFSQLFGARLLVGFGEACLFPAGTSLLLGYFPPRQRATAIGVFLMGSALGGGVAVLIGGLLLDLFTSRFTVMGLGMEPWRWVLVSLAAPGILVAALLTTVREPPRHQAEGFSERPSRFAGLGALWHRRRVVGLLLLALVFQAVADYGSSAWFPSMLVRDFGLPPAQAAVRLGWVILPTAIVGPTLGGIVADLLHARGHAGRKPLVTATMLFSGVPLCYMYFAPSVGLAILLFGGLTLLMGVGVVAATVSIQDVIEDSARGTLIGAQAFSQTIIGLGCGPTAVALISDSRIGHLTGIGTAIACVVAPCLFLGGVCAAAVKGPYQRAIRGPPSGVCRTVSLPSLNPETRFPT